MHSPLCVLLLVLAGALTHPHPQASSPRPRGSPPPLACALGQLRSATQYDPHLA